jgi:hypothetical protein
VPTAGEPFFEILSQLYGGTSAKVVAPLVGTRFVDSSPKNVKQNDFNNEAAGSGWGEVKQSNFKIDDILDGFVSDNRRLRVGCLGDLPQ